MPSIVTQPDSTINRFDRAIWLTPVLDFNWFLGPSALANLTIVDQPDFATNRFDRAVWWTQPFNLEWFGVPLPPEVTVLRVRTLTVQPALFDTGLEGSSSFTIQIVDTSNVSVLAPTNTGITEFPAGSTIYSYTTGPILDDRVQYKVIWYDSTGPFWAVEDILPIYPSDHRASGLVEDSNPGASGFNAAASGLSSSDHFYRRMWLIFSTGTLAGVPRRITGYTGNSHTFAFGEPFPADPANGDQFDILGYGG